MNGTGKRSDGAVRALKWAAGFALSAVVILAVCGGAWGLAADKPPWLPAWVSDLGAISVVTIPIWTTAIALMGVGFVVSLLWMVCAMLRRDFGKERH